MTEMSKTHCGLCARALSASNKTGLGTECKSKLPETLTVALLNRSEHAYHDGGSDCGKLSHEDLKNAFDHLGGTADMLIFISGFSQGQYLLEEGLAHWEIWYKSTKGIHFIDATQQREPFAMEGEYKGTMLDGVEMRKLVLLMCSKSTKTKVQLTWVDSELGFMMNRAHYNGPYPIGMNLEEWAKEIHDVSHENFPVCFTCDQAQGRRETVEYHELEIEERNENYKSFRIAYPNMRYSLYRDIVEIYNEKNSAIIDRVTSMFDDITKDEQNCSEPFLGGPMWYDPTDSHQAFWNYNSVQAGEIGWLTIYGNHIFTEYLLPYLLKEAYDLFDEDWTPRKQLPEEDDKPDYIEWARKKGGIAEAEKIGIRALRHTLYEMYPRAMRECTADDCEFCGN